MAQAAPVTPQPAQLLEFRRAPSRADVDLHFELVLFRPEGLAKSRAKTLTVSLTAHAVLAALAILSPILSYDSLPAPSESARAFFVAPLEAAPPPPPPPPPPAGARPQAKAPAPAPPPEDAKFVAPIETPAEIKPEPTGIDLGVEGGVPGGVEGGVPGGVIGGIVGGLPTDLPSPPPSRAVRVGGQIKAPKLLHVVPPQYPDLAAQARLTAIVIAEALVDTSGRVREVKILRGAPLFDDAAVAAVKQWRYQPLLLNGVPTEFILTVTVKFNLNQP
jgi:protein TonB